MCGGTRQRLDWVVPTVAWLIPGGPDITPDDFKWYFYKGRAVGIQEDLTCNSICNGKLLLGSFMKKPLWVDHSANTVSSVPPVPRSISPLLFFKSHVSSSQVFNLLTSSVKVSVNGRESHFTPAQSFMVQSGESLMGWGSDSTGSSGLLANATCLFTQEKLTASRTSPCSPPSCTSPGYLLKAPTDSSSHRLSTRNSPNTNVVFLLNLTDCLYWKINCIFKRKQLSVCLLVCDSCAAFCQITCKWNVPVFCSHVLFIVGFFPTVYSRRFVWTFVLESSRSFFSGHQNLSRQSCVLIKKWPMSSLKRLLVLFDFFFCWFSTLKIWLNVFQK